MVSEPISDGTGPGAVAAASYFERAHGGGVELQYGEEPGPVSGAAGDASGGARVQEA